MLIKYGSDYKVEVTAGEHIIKNIYTHVKNGTLTIDNNNKCNFVRGYKRQVNVTVTVPRIKMAENRGVATMTFDDAYHQDSIFVLAESSGDVHVNGTFDQIITSSHGNGDMYLNGTTHSLYVYTNGINFLRAADLNITGNVFIETLSIGDCYVNATNAQKLSYHIWDSGNIYYTGNPPVIENVSSGSEKGKLIQE